MVDIARAPDFGSCVTLRLRPPFNAQRCGLIGLAIRNGAHSVLFRGSGCFPAMH
jgi:hypothetical protein